MKLKSQVVSLELAKKMKELGFKQESLFYHNFKIHGEWAIDKRRGWSDSVSAYTVAELSEILPIGDRWAIGYGRLERKGVSIVDVMAKMLIYLAENELLPPQK